MGEELSLNLSCFVIPSFKIEGGILSAKRKHLFVEVIPLSLRTPATGITYFLTLSIF